MARSHAQPSTEVKEAAWIGRRLSPLSSGLVTSVVPAGFEAYLRVLHPLSPFVHGQEPVRWHQVAAWTGVELRTDIDFPEIALPVQEPTAVEPWPGQVPEVGTLHPADASALAALLTRHTRTPERCWFCTWEGWGSVSFEDGPRVELPARRYALATGPVTALLSLTDAQDGHSPNLWWPDDRAWCVATEIDLAWTYVGGTRALINDLLASPRLEAQRSWPEDNFHQRLPAWLTPVIEDATKDLLESGAATLRIWRGVINAQWEQPHGSTGGELHIQRSPTNGSGGSSWTRIGERDPVRLRDVVTSALTWAVIELL